MLYGSKPSAIFLYFSAFAAVPNLPLVVEFPPSADLIAFDTVEEAEDLKGIDPFEPFKLAFELLT